MYTAVRMRLWGCLPALVFVLLAAAPAGARTGATSRGVSRSDIAATRAYLHDRHELDQAEARETPAETAAIPALIAHVRSACPNALAGAPETKVIGALRFQTLSQLAHADDEPTRDAQILFTERVKRIHWSNRKLTYYVHGSAEEARANVELTIPDICSEANAIAASGYQTTPATMAQFEREELAANSKVDIVVQPHEKIVGSLEEMILAMLKPYERPDDRALIRPRPTGQQLEQAFKQFFSYATEIIQALGLPAEATSSEPPSPAPLARPAGFTAPPFR
jgi:hypothetical protein